MDARTIAVGDTLYLKPERAAAYGLDGRLMVKVYDKRAPKGYLTPYIYDAEGHAYRPSDFLRRANIQFCEICKFIRPRHDYGCPEWLSDTQD
jgi:hypothetical protein